MISFDGVKVGDRVRLTAERGEDVTIIVTYVAPRRPPEYFQAAHGAAYVAEDWDTVEVLSPPKPPLPTVDGVYMPATQTTDSGPNVFVRYDGRWGSQDEWVDAAEYHQAVGGLVRLVPEGEPSGLLEVAKAAHEWVARITDPVNLWGDDTDVALINAVSALDAIKAEEAQS